MKSKLWLARYEVKKWWHDRLPAWVAHRVPRKVAYWCAIRVGVNATQGPYSNQVVPELLFTESLQRWDTRRA